MASDIVSTCQRKELLVGPRGGLDLKVDFAAPVLSVHPDATTKAIREPCPGALIPPEFQE